MRRSLAGVAVCCALAGCSGGDPAEPAATVPDQPSGLMTQVVEDARDVADDLERRQADLEQRGADLESMIP